MKKIIVLCLIIFSIMISSESLLAQSGPPSPPGDPDVAGGEIGGAAPIDGGIGILLVLGASYALKRIYFLKKSLLNEELEN